MSDTDHEGHVNKAVYSHLQLMNQEHVIRKLEDSAPIRKAAKFTVYVLQRGKQRAQDGFESIINSKAMKNAENKEFDKSKSAYESFKERFGEELDKGMTDLHSKNKSGKR